MINSRLPLVTATSFRSRGELLHVPEAHLLPKLRCQFAEFLNHGSLTRLGILYLSTCVGLRYGHPGCSLEVFLGGMELASWLGRSRASPLSSELMTPRICLEGPPRIAATHFQSCVCLSFRVTPSLKRTKAVPEY